jgi:hypothetical protein
MTDLSMQKGIGVFSDIHGNRKAFAAIVDVVRSRRDLEWHCLGDVVGWFFRPVECVLMLKSLVDEGLVKGVVAGNHDLMALGDFTDSAQRTDRMLATAFSAGMLEQCPEARDFLRSFEPRTISGSTWIAAHHSPFGLPGAGEQANEAHYGHIDADLPSQLPAWASSAKRVVLTGHGHAALVYGLPIDARAPRPEDIVTWRPERDDERTTIELRDGWRYWVRNGTVGGPYYDGRVGAHWTEYRPGESITLHRLDYDTRELEADIMAHQSLIAHRDTWQKKVLPGLRAARAQAAEARPASLSR